MACGCGHGSWLGSSLWPWPVAVAMAPGLWHSPKLSKYVSKYSDRRLWLWSAAVALAPGQWHSHK